MTPAPLPWRPAPRMRRLVTTGALAVAVAVVTGHAGLLLLAAPVLAALAAGQVRRRPPAPGIQVTVSPARCFEGERVEVVATVTGTVDETTFRLEPGPGMRLADGPAVQASVQTGTVQTGTVQAATVQAAAVPPTIQAAARARWVVVAGAWGCHIPGTVTARCRLGGMWQADLTMAGEQCEVFPHPPPASATLIPADLLHRIGDHTARVAGMGTEFHAVRAYQPGDRLRDVNWAVSSRTGTLQVNQRSAATAADLVVIIDAFSEAGPPGETTLDLALHGAAGLARAYLRTGDRVGVVALGGILRWLAPAPGDRQFFRIAETVLNVRFASHAIPDLDRIPYTALPPGALAVLFSPLLDQRAVDAVTDLRQRGISLVVVDVLRHEPPARPGDGLSRLAVRVWRLDRRALRSGLTNLGVPVLDWEAGTDLDAALAPLRGRPLPAVHQ